MLAEKKINYVAPREGRVSRNAKKTERYFEAFVAPREGRVSRNP